MAGKRFHITDLKIQTWYGPTHTFPQHHIRDFRLPLTPQVEMLDWDGPWITKKTKDESRQNVSQIKPMFCRWHETTPYHGHAYAMQYTQ